MIEHPCPRCAEPNQILDDVFDCKCAHCNYEWVRTPGLTVGQLRKALEGRPDWHSIIVTATGHDDEEGDTEVTGGIVALSLEYAHDEDDSPFVRMAVSDDVEDFEPQSDDEVVDARDGARCR